MSLILFIITLLVGLLLLSVACVVWLAELCGSLVVALVVVGLVYIVVAAMLYALSLRPAIVSWRQRLDTIYDVSATIEMIYAKALLFIKHIKSE